ALFLQPVHLHLQLPNLLIELLDQLLLLTLPTVGRSALEDTWTRIEQQAFPLGNLHRMHAERTCELVQRLLPFKGFQGDAGLEGPTMPPTWPFPAGFALAVLYAHAHTFSVLLVQSPLLL